jgi:gas vesicle protein
MRSLVIMRAFLAGLGIGIGLGLIFAPMSGEETRERLSQRAGDLADSARDLVGQGRERVRDTVSAMRGKAERFREGEEPTGTSGLNR